MKPFISWLLRDYYLFNESNDHSLICELQTKVKDRSVSWEDKHFFSFILDKVLAAINKRNQLKIKGIKIYSSKQSMTSSGSIKTKIYKYYLSDESNDHFLICELWRIIVEGLFRIDFFFCCTSFFMWYKKCLSSKLSVRSLLHWCFLMH